jgi:hypothetical protein
VEGRGPVSARIGAGQRTWCHCASPHGRYALPSVPAQNTARHFGRSWAIFPAIGSCAERCASPPTLEAAQRTPMRPAHCRPRQSPSVESAPRLAVGSVPTGMQWQEGSATAPDVPSRNGWLIAARIERGEPIHGQAGARAHEAFRVSHSPRCLRSEARGRGRRPGRHDPTDSRPPAVADERGGADHEDGQHDLEEEAHGQGWRIGRGQGIAQLCRARPLSPRRSPAAGSESRS